MLAAPILLALSIPAAGGGPGPIDFAAVPRAIATLPELGSDAPLYGLFLFGVKGETRVWAVLDRPAAGGAYDRLYLDLDADGDLTDAGESFAGEREAEERVVFEIGEYREPGREGVVHAEWTITWAPKRVSYKMLWRGEKRTMGAFGPTPDDYGDFGRSLAEAPILVPGYDLPFQFEHWMSGTLEPGETKDFKVFVGNRGSAKGQFSTVDDKFLPKDEYVLATLIYTDERGREQRYEAKLKERC